MTEPRIERIGDAILYLGDCYTIVPGLPPADAVVTDPPYGIGYAQDSKARCNLHNLWGDGAKRELGGKAAAPIVGDDRPFDPTPFLSAGKRLVFWGASAYADKLPANYGWFIWDKQIVGKWSGGDAETAWTNWLGSNRIFRHRWQGIQRAGEECPFVGGGLVHPTQKPQALMAWCLSFLPDCETVLDPFMGSGTTGVACVNMGRKFIGIEIDPKYFATACERIGAAYKQQRLFA